MGFRWQLWDISKTITGTKSEKNKTKKKQRGHKTKRARIVVLRNSRTTANIEQQSSSKGIIRKHFNH